MNTTLKRIISGALLLIFLSPLVIKIGHHHDDSHMHKHFCFSPFLDTSDTLHLSEHHKVCPICKFEFSVFVSYKETIKLKAEYSKTEYLNNYKSVFYSRINNYSFLLRAPPSLISNLSKLS